MYNHTPLRKAVLSEIYSNVVGMSLEEAEAWVTEDAICINGAVTGLIYYHDTVSFFDNHEEEILELASEYEFDVSVVNEGMTKFKNDMSWFAFETLKETVFNECKGFLVECGIKTEDGESE